MKKILPQKAQLTPREVECLEWAAQGKSSGEIATILNLTERGVNYHFESAKEKLDATNRTQAVAIAVSRGIVELSE
jgi:DNA-binding CsgD family transcriptional regulator